MQFNSGDIVYLNGSRHEIRPLLFGVGVYVMNLEGEKTSQENAVYKGNYKLSVDFYTKDQFIKAIKQEKENEEYIERITGESRVMEYQSPENTDRF